MKKALYVVYGLICYTIFFASFVYLIGFVADVVVPKSIDSGTAGALWPSLALNVGLLGLFGLQHSVMARSGFKEWWTNVVAEPIERSTYVLAASLAVILLMALWRPIPEVVWTVEAKIGRITLWAIQGIGWGLVLYTTFLISHAHLFGVKQVYQHWRDREPASPEFQTPSLYRHVRHPMMGGFFLAFWSTPHMTVGHLVFTIGMTTYILIALRFEERDLLETFGDKYRRYRQRVPMFIPGLGRRTTEGELHMRREHSRRSEQETVQS